MKSTLKFVLLAALFCGTAMADDGDMGNGGLWAGTGTIVTAPTTEDGDMGNGGKTCPPTQTTCFAGSSEEEGFSILDYLSGLFL